MAIQEREWLKNIETGGIFPSTPHLRKLAHMIPCSSPEIEKQVPGLGHEMKDDKDEQEGLSKEEGFALIHKWFGRTVDRVKVDDLYEYAKEQTGEDFPEKMTKLQIVTKLAAELAVREE